jgi:hypothetical protein
VIGELGHGADARARRAHRIRLVDRDRGRDPLDAVRARPIHPIEELPRVGREGLDVAALTLRVDRIEGQRGLARSADAGHDDQLVQRQPQVDALQVVLTRAANDDRLALGAVVAASARAPPGGPRILRSASAGGA